MPSHRGHALRRGRCSLPGHGYLITAVTRNRIRWFDDIIIARAAARSFYADSVAWEAKTLAFVVMPDHVHWLLQLDGDLSEAVRRYKSLVSHQAGASIWQRGFHDRGLRREEELRQVARYIVANPLRAGLVDNILDYPYWDAIWL
jgi:putative transposase